LFQIGRFLKIFFSETAWPNEPKLGGEHPFENAEKADLWNPLKMMDQHVKSKNRAITSPDVIL
jgi:hypothetical protein